MKIRRVLVVNPNSNAEVTRGLRRALAPFDRPDLKITCQHIPEAPFGIESDEDVRTVGPLIVERIAEGKDFDGYVIACYSDPAVEDCRAITRKPVLGIQQSAVVTCLAFGGRFGVLALGPESIRRHLVYLRQLGLESHLAGERPLHISVDQAANDPDTGRQILQEGKLLIEETGARTLILGCAGLSCHRPAAEAALGVPVIDPTQAAVSLLMGHLLTGPDSSPHDS